MSDLNITTRRLDGVTVMDLDGGIAIGTSSAELNSALRELVTAGKNRILINLANVRMIDSSGLGSLVSGFATVEKSGGLLKLTNLSPRVTELMTITRLYTVFEIFEDEQTALKSFSQANDRITSPLDGNKAADAAGSSLL